MEITLSLGNQMSFDISASEFDPVAFTKGLNEPQVKNVTIGSIVANKDAIISIIPKDQVDPNVTLYLNNGDAVHIRVEDYNAAELTRDLNDPRLTMIVLGNSIINKYMFMMLVPDNTGEVINHN